MLTRKQTDALNLIRWISVLSIFICHILQGYGNIWAWILNIGVQIFFFLSGFLYGNKRISNIRNFYKGRLIKIYIPFALWVTVAIMILYIFSPGSISVKKILFQYATISTLPGLTHLWFMNVIFICYLLLPFVDRNMNKKPTITIMILLICFGVFLSFWYQATFLWITLYYLGYLCGRYARIQKYFFIISALITIWILSYSEFSLLIFKEDSIKNNILHASAGILIFTGLYLGTQRISFNNKISHTLTNGWGYEIYLTHHLFILGPLSMLFITENSICNILIIVLITFICSYGLMKTNSLLRRIVYDSH